nr:Mur ligase family protein [Gemmatimonadota bacterium]
KIGRYTSPHLIDFRERITVDSVPIPEDAVLEFLEQWTPTAEGTGATFFELTTALAFDWFARQRVDFAVIETGLGGRLDSTNVLTPRVATVTSIGLDHTDLLGDTLQAIAREKAGIFKRGVPAVIGESAPEIRSLLLERAKESGADPIIVVDDEYQVSDIEISTRGTSFTLATGSGQQRVTTPLIGAFQARNTAIAIATVAALGPPYLPAQAKISTKLEKIFLRGRFQRWRSFIFDVAHNPDGARAVAEAIRALNPLSPRIAIVAVLADKDWKGIIRALAPTVDRFVFTNTPSAPPGRRWDPAQAQAYAKSQGFNSLLEPDLDSALKSAQQSGKTVLVTGSFHTVGDVMSRLQVSPFAA